MKKTYSKRTLRDGAKQSTDVRALLGLRQVDLANAVGCGGTLICDIEKKRVSPTELVIEVKRKISALLREAKRVKALNDLKRPRPKVPPPMPVYPKAEKPVQQDLPFKQEAPKSEEPPVCTIVEDDDEELKRFETETDQLEEVQFYDINFLAVRTKDGESAVSVPSICKALGLNIQGQTTKLGANPDWAARSDIYVRNPGDLRPRQTWLLHEADVPVWLYTINSERVSPEARTTLKRLRREIRAVIKLHFAKKARTVVAMVTPDTSFMRLAIAFEKLVELDGRRDERFDKLMQKQEETASHIEELTVQVGRSNRINYTAAVGEIANVKHIGDGRFKNKVDGTISLSHQHLMRRIRSDQRIIDAEKRFKSLIDDHKTAWLAQLLGVRRVITNLREKGPPLENSEADSLPWKHYRENENDIDSLIEGFYFLLSIGYPSWRTKEQRVVDGNTRNVPYPNLDDARKQMRIKGWMLDQIELNIQGFLMKIPKLGEDIVAATNTRSIPSTTKEST